MEKLKQTLNKTINSLKNLKLYKQWYFWSSCAIIIFVICVISTVYSSSLKQLDNTSNKVSKQLATPTPSIIPTIKPTDEPDITNENSTENTDTPPTITQSTPVPTNKQIETKTTPQPTPVSSSNQSLNNSKPAPTPTPVTTPVTTPVSTPKPTTPPSTKSPTPSNQHVTVENNKIEGVWIGETGNKYHNKNCRTLKGNKYEISLEEAKAQGREPCKVCR